jgi:hypothetical protein
MLRKQFQSQKGFPHPSRARRGEKQRSTSLIQNSWNLLFRAFEKELVGGLEVEEAPK